MPGRRRVPLSGRGGALAAGLALLPLAAGLAACEPDALTSRAPGGCRTAGEQCALSGGRLGVCERKTCAPGEEPPCFACTPQH